MHKHEIEDIEGTKNIIFDFDEHDSPSLRFSKSAGLEDESKHKETISQPKKLKDEPKKAIPYKPKYTTEQIMAGFGISTAQSAPARINRVNRTFHKDDVEEIAAVDATDSTIEIDDKGTVSTLSQQPTQVNRHKIFPQKTDTARNDVCEHINGRDKVNSGRDSEYGALFPFSLK